MEPFVYDKLLRVWNTLVNTGLTKSNDPEVMRAMAQLEILLDMFRPPEEPEATGWRGWFK